MIAQSIPIDPERLNNAVGRFLGDVDAAVSGALVLSGDRLGYSTETPFQPHLRSSAVAS
jgi:hypothetical protein